ncbi:MAG: hypothetical protein GXP37_14125 [Chloroflexi bacterium]|nr:hypothetical protein [Chloroflexota bacterium]
MLNFLRFWFILQLFGLVAMPLAWRLFAHLPDRGYTFSKPLGLLAAGYVLWLGASLGVLRNNAGGAVLAMALVLLLGVWLGRAGLHAGEDGERPLIAFFKQRWRLVLTSELLFLLAMAAWAFFRAYNPDIAGTEKPMEFAFLNGILASPQFPPHDPWLAGYGISYYYFGYVQLNMLVQLSGVIPGVAFNLGLAAIFALTVLGAFGLGYNLVAGDTKPARGLRAGLYGGLSALFVAVMGNLEVILEVLRTRGLLTPGLQKFFDIKDLGNAPVTGSWRPEQFWWWWRASRTIHDYNFSGTANQEVIDEFPMFSFLLGDMHPHVLALPFVLLTIALALNLFRRPTPELAPVPDSQGEETAWVQGIVRDWRSAGRCVVAGFGLDGWGLPIYGMALGALGFLNTWDFPIYLFLVTLVYALRRGFDGVRRDAHFWREIIITFVGLFLIGFIAYLPFYVSFSSQAGGILPNLYNPTRFAQFFLMFGPFLVATIALLGVALRRHPPQRASLASWGLTVLLLPLLFLFAIIIFGGINPGLRHLVERTLGQPVSTVIPHLLSLRLQTPFTWLVVGGLLTLIAVLAMQVWSKSEKRPSRHLVFVLALLFTALLLTYGVEFVYLRDSFGTRMNTVFKFYYQAWVLMAVASAYALHYIHTRASASTRYAIMIVMTLLVLGGLLYPAFAIPSKANNFQGDPTLDGAHFVAVYRPDEAAVIQWLRQNTPLDAVIVEATGGSYTDFDTISAHSGRATLLGWGGHELQWRGTYDIPGQREPEIETLYRNQDRTAVRLIVAKYGIDYLIVGPREIDKYKIPPNRLSAFEPTWEPVFIDGSTTVYRWRGG